jgi:hypothetical protein
MEVGQNGVCREAHAAGTLAKYATHVRDSPLSNDPPVDHENPNRTDLRKGLNGDSATVRNYSSWSPSVASMLRSEASFWVLEPQRSRTLCRFWISLSDSRTKSNRRGAFLPRISNHDPYTLLIDTYIKNPADEGSFSRSEV